MRIIIDWILKIVFPNLLQNPHLSFVILNTNNEFNISGSLKKKTVIASRETAWQSPNHKKQT